MSKTAKMEKPLGRKNYGSIGHLPNSRLGPGDHSVTDGQARICCTKKRDKHDTIIVQEKLDGSNVGVALHQNEILALGRAGYLAQTSPYEQHQLFAYWVRRNEPRFRAVLKEGERLVGEWLAQAHGTIYALSHEPLVVFDLMTGIDRFPYRQFLDRVNLGGFIPAALLSEGDSFSVEDALAKLGTHGFHGAEKSEGAVWRVERNKRDPKIGERFPVVDFLAKYVRPEKAVDGAYLPEISGQPARWNWRPDARPE